jgi:hypothetical protein
MDSPTREPQYGLRIEPQVVTDAADILSVTTRTQPDDRHNFGLFSFSQQMCCLAAHLYISLVVGHPVSLEAVSRPCHHGQQGSTGLTLCHAHCEGRGPPPWILSLANN